MAFSLHLRDGCGGGPLVEWSYDFATVPRYKYVIRRATSASYSVGSGSPVGIGLTDNAAVGYIAWSNSPVTITARGCGCDAVEVIPPCCAGKDYLRLSFSGFSDLAFRYERTLPPPNFGSRNIFGSWETTVTGLGALNGTWLLPTSSGDQCVTPALDTGIDITWSCRWYSHGARYVSTRQITGEQWTQDLVGTVGFRLWLSSLSGFGNVFITGSPGTMVGSASKTAGLSGAYNYTFNSIWTPKITAGLGTYEPLVFAGNGIVNQFSASPDAAFISVGTTSLLNFAVGSCGERRAAPVYLTQYGNGSHWVDGEGFQPAYHHSNTGPVSYPGPARVGTVEAEFIDVP